jgi:xanthine permease XanP
VQGGAWGARTDVMHRVAHALTEVAEARDELMTPGGDVRVDLAFDEYRVDLRIEYDGLPIDLTDAAPLGPGDLDAIDVGDVRARLRAGLIRRLADRVDARPCGPGRQLMRLRFEH